LLVCADASVSFNSVRRLHSVVCCESGGRSILMNIRAAYNFLSVLLRLLLYMHRRLTVDVLR
jgi:hypothetical protein